EDREAEIESLRILGNLERRAGRLETAIERGRAALELATTLAHPLSVAEVQRDLGEIYLAAGRKDEAARSLDQAADGFARLGVVFRSAQLHERVTAIQRGRS